MAEPEDIECEGTDEVVCPYCGYEFEASWEFFSESHRMFEEIDCNGCGKKFRATADYSVTYYSEKIDGT